MEQKKFYEQPKTEVFEMKVQGQILAQSDEDLAPEMHEPEF